MTRKYTLKRRAEQKAETRQRIVEAAVELHGTVGPAQTTYSKVAERAGVQRHTLYAHFPDEMSLLRACSAHHLETNPPPDAAAWTTVVDRRERLRRALGEIYTWYERNAELIASVLRDAEHHDATREITEIRFGPHFESWMAALDSGGGPADQKAMLALALSFHTWRTLARDAGRGTVAAAEAMAAAVFSTAEANSGSREPATIA